MRSNPPRGVVDGLSSRRTARWTAWVSGGLLLAFAVSKLLSPVSADGRSLAPESSAFAVFVTRHKSTLGFVGGGLEALLGVGIFIPVWRGLALALATNYLMFLGVALVLLLQSGLRVELCGCLGTRLRLEASWHFLVLGITLGAVSIAAWSGERSLARS